MNWDDCYDFPMKNYYLLKDVKRKDDAADTDDKKCEVEKQSE